MKNIVTGVIGRIEHQEIVSSTIQGAPLIFVLLGIVAFHGFLVGDETHRGTGVAIVCGVKVRLVVGTIIIGEGFVVSSKCWDGTGLLGLE